MFKLLTVVVLMVSTIMPIKTFASDNSILPGQLSTKGLIRMSLWYEGLEETRKTENQEVTGMTFSEELERALLDV